MPVVLDTPASPSRRPGALRLGLLNNLGDAGMAAGERQWMDLLGAAAGLRFVELRLFSLASIARDAGARARMQGLYRDGDALRESHLDGLIVTGAEPRAADLRGETFWPELAAVVDWARTGPRSTIWSCLAAHAAVLHRDGIARRRLPAKCTGVFAVAPAASHPLLDELDHPLQVCHSRWNDLAEADLAAAGYTVLTRGAMGVDAFVVGREHPFLCLQGHPEYDGGALERETRRDLLRWQADPARTPQLPMHYFAPAVEAALRRHVAAGDAAAALAALEITRTPQSNPGVTLVRNWLRTLRASSLAQRGTETMRGMVEGAAAAAIIGESCTP